MTFTSVVSCQQSDSNLVMIQCYGSCKKTVTQNTDQSYQSTGKGIMELMKFIARQCHLILCTHRKRMATTQDQFKKEKNWKLSIFSFGDKAAMEVLYHRN